MIVALVLGSAIGASAASREEQARRPVLQVKSVWGVFQRRYCGHEILASIEAALKAFQQTKIANTSRCLPEDESAFLKRTGCGHGARAEIIRLSSPVQLKDLMWSNHRSPKVYSIIAYWDDVHPSRLKLGLGHFYAASSTGLKPEVLYMSVTSPVDFLNLGSGECSMASPSRVPSSI